MRLFGTALNFFGGPGESHHKYFVKAPGDNTQRRVSEFAKQISNRIYENMIFEIAKEALQQQEDVYEQVGNPPSDASSDEMGEDTKSIFVGKYELKINNVNEDGENSDHVLKWSWQNKQKKKDGRYQLHPDLLRVVFQETKRKYLTECKMIGFTEMRTVCD